MCFKYSLKTMATISLILFIITSGDFHSFLQSTKQISKNELHFLKLIIKLIIA